MTSIARITRTSWTARQALHQDAHTRSKPGVAIGDGLPVKHRDGQRDLPSVTTRDCNPPDLPAHNQRSSHSPGCQTNCRCESRRHRLRKKIHLTKDPSSSCRPPTSSCWSGCRFLSAVCRGTRSAHGILVGYERNRYLPIRSRISSAMKAVGRYESVEHPWLRSRLVRGPGLRRQWNPAS